nr:hypothetical protein [Verrucosispora sp.]
MLLGAEAFGLGFGDPAGDDGRVGACVEGCSVAVEFRVAFGDRWSQWSRWYCAGYAEGELIEDLGGGVAALQWSEFADEPVSRLGTTDALLNKIGC